MDNPWDHRWPRLQQRSIASKTPAPSSAGVWGHTPAVNEWRKDFTPFLGEAILFGSGSSYRISGDAPFATRDTSREFELHRASVIKGASELLAEIRASLSLNIKELATVLQVERPTIYAWIRESSKPQRQNLRRLHQLHRLAQVWNRLSNKPLGDEVRAFDNKERSILHYLAEEDIPEAEVRRCFESSVERIKKQNMGKKGIREIAQERGFDLSKIKRRDDVFDMITGKRVSPE